VEKYLNKEDGTVVELVSESPNGEFVMLQREGVPENRWIIESKKFCKQYSKKVNPN